MKMLLLGVAAALLVAPLVPSPAGLPAASAQTGPLHEALGPVIGSEPPDFVLPPKPRDRQVPQGRRVVGPERAEAGGEVTVTQRGQN